MDCIAVFKTSNYVYKMESALKKKGYKFEIVPTPCHVARGGCSLCLKFPEEYLSIVRLEAISCNTPVRAIFRIIPGEARNRHERI
ncbi:MAG: hypothetical protein K0R50_3574 [Eubacterium sp.]|jgi:hypothetical protein|nr:hypothetical protein [Eubacterium sp.]